MPRTYAGVMPPLSTPLTQSGELDVPAVGRFVEHVLAGGVHGVVVMGSSGEAALLHPRTRRAMIEATLQAVAGRVPVVAGTGESGTVLTAEMTREVAQLGASAAIVIPPFYYQHDQEAVKRHYRTVREVGRLPLLAYHIPGLTKVPILSDTLLELAEEGTVCGVKDSAGEFGYFQRVVDGSHKIEDFSALQGSDQFVYAAGLYGGDGVISVMSQAAPAVMVALDAAARAGDAARARRLHTRYQEIARAVGPGWIPAFKSALYNMGVFSSPQVMPPNAPWTEQQIAAQRTRLDAAQASNLFDPSTA